MKRRLQHIGLVLASFIGYLEWGDDQQMLLIQIEWDVIKMVFTNFGDTLHPLIWMPLFGQVLLLIAGFKNTPSMRLSFLGIGFVGVLLYFMFVIGFLSGSWLISASTLPYIAMSIWTVVDMRRDLRQSSG